MNPPRSKLPSAREELNESTAPHTPVPSAAPTDPPPAMPMPPPRAYAAPRPRLGSLRDEQPVEELPAPVGQVTVGRGPWTLSMPSAVALALITSVSGFAIAWLNKPSPGDPAQIAITVESSLAKNREETTKQLTAFDKRLDVFETKLTETQSAVGSLRDRVNDKIIDLRAPTPTPLGNQIATQLRK